MSHFERELSWVRTHMPKLKRALACLPDLSGMRLACNMHLDIKMAPFVVGLAERGAELFISTCNPQTVRDPVVHYLSQQGVEGWAWNGMDEKSYYDAIEAALDWQPTHLCEMGAELSSALARRNARGTAGTGTISAGLEATGSGISRLSDVSLSYPIYNWDDLPVKEGLHNRRMVGLTAWHVFFERTGLTLHDMRVLVVGYGSVGRGVAEAARAYGGAVTVCERDPGRRLEASFAGWHVAELSDELPKADVVITATGAENVISRQHFGELKDGVFLLNVGHLWREIDVEALSKYPKSELFPHVEEYRLEHERRLYLLAGGSMVNLTAGRGDSINAFDVTLAVLTGGVGYIAGSGAEREPGLYTLPPEAWLPYVTDS